MMAFLQKLWIYVKPYRGRLFLGVFCGVIFGLSNGALIVAIQTVVNTVFGGGAGHSLADELKKAPDFLRPLANHISQWLPAEKSISSKTGTILIIMTVPITMLIRNIFSYLNIYLMTWSAARAVADLRTRVFAHLQELPLSFFSKAKTGDLISRVTNDTHVLYGIIGNSLSSLVKDPVTILVLLCIMVIRQPRLTLVSIIVLPVCMGPIIIYGRKVRKSAKAMQGHMSDLTNLMHESFTGNRIIKAYNMEEAILKLFGETTKKYVNHIMRVIRANEIPSQLTEFLGAVGVALVLLYVAFAADGTKTPGEFVSFLLSIVLMYQPIKSLTKLHNQMAQAAAASHRVFELLDTKSTIVDPPSPVPLKAAQADIEFDDITFTYEETPVLRNVSLTVKRGQLVALVGFSGSGKTTLVNLLLRFYDPQQGSVRIGGVDLRQVALKDLRSQVALVTQETILFNETISKNIGLGRPGATEAEIETAARLAHAHEFILAKPQGYQTIVGEKGAMVSGGQRQRIAIARAILKDAPILILDEATSSLDSEVERAVQQSLDQLMQGRTTLCIAHRLSTIQNADLIVVLDAGRIVETGTHQELIAARGIYWRLHDLQFGAAAATSDVVRSSIVS
jgi:subfamily B ATP-binding cassette protein MsbA